jgi:hypothetical protein
VEIDADDAVPILERRLGDGRVRPDGRVADQHVDSAQLGEPLLDHGVDGRGVRDVAQHGDGAHAGLAALGRHRLELLAIDARVQHEIRALGREGQRDGAADIPAGARDERRPALELHPATRRRSRSA